eukprot:TRINITY_DN7993_c0_g1_i1.p1 TRINITY_DN7993_c0_g1~~TRINITY_DN7993_c0_g1_i1.p1  ORF type:complete len:161 (-),score=3.58 TRINITY_DN7993_c0_g1_i1:36-518(-)
MYTQLRRYLPARFRYMDLERLFSTSTDGTSLYTFYKKLEDVEPTLILIKDMDDYVFGGFCTQAWEVRPDFYGTGESFLFSLKPVFAVYRWTSANTYFMHSTHRCIAMGGGTTGRHGFWLDSELHLGTSSVSKTFLNRRLSNAEEFECKTLEVWCFKHKWG